MVTPGKNVSAHRGDMTSLIGGRIQASLGAKVIRAIGVARIHCLWGQYTLRVGGFDHPRGSMMRVVALGEQIPG